MTVLSLEELMRILLPLEARSDSPTIDTEAAEVLFQKSLPLVEGLEPKVTKCLRDFYEIDVPKLHKSDDRTWKSVRAGSLQERLQKFSVIRAPLPATVKIDATKTQFQTLHSALVEAVKDLCRATACKSLAGTRKRVGICAKQQWDPIEAAEVETKLGEGDESFVFALQKAAFCVATYHRTLREPESAECALSEIQAVLHVLNGSPSLAFDCLLKTYPSSPWAAALLTGLVLTMGRDPSEATYFASAGLDAIDISGPSFELHTLRSLAMLVPRGPNLCVSSLSAALDDAETAFRLRPDEPSAVVARTLLGFELLARITSHEAFVGASDKRPALLCLRDHMFLPENCDICAPERICHACAWLVHRELRRGVDGCLEVEENSLTMQLLARFCFDPSTELREMPRDPALAHLLTYLHAVENGAQDLAKDHTYRGVEWLWALTRHSKKKGPDVTAAFEKALFALSDLSTPPLSVSVLQAFHANALARLNLWDLLPAQLDALAFSDQHLNDIILPRFLRAVELAIQGNHRTSLEELSWLLTERPTDLDFLLLGAAAASATS
ncbi:MAG: hypothetical protein KVP17_000639 [Porospora cf. gigantea B]|nr:MAG: hypothetical protein KVP17_000639 [Porospora cf. gigantea B]